MDKTIINHPSNTIHNKKIQRMMLKYGLSGYGFFWGVIELMATMPECKMPKTLAYLEKISQSNHKTLDEVSSILKDFIEIYGILTLEGNFIVSGLLTPTPISLKVLENKKLAEELFLRLWKLYPEKRGKASVKITKKLELLGHGEEALNKCIERYKKYIEVTNYPYKMGSSFFNTGYVDYLDENFVATENKPSIFKDTVKDKVKENANRFSDKNVTG